ncbi:MAG: M48 family metallopeptidase [Dehalococcoidia bacterium]|nr:M48 family metallopeptidase [Dehalococcoidia bacterium]
MWEEIRSNQIRSGILVASMAVLLLLIGYFLGLILLDSAVAGLIIAFIVWVISVLIAFFQGDSILLAVSGARKIGPDDHPRLYNVVEEMKIASGLEKMPDVYIIEDPALNAFAAGRDPNRAAVAVTRGLLDKLNRDELQGVIAHEMAHIKNRDVLLMAVAAVLVGSIVLLAWYATRILFFRTAFGGRRGGGGGGLVQIILLIVGLVLIILAPIAARLIYFAISRRREYLADASSALYTRYPEGLASALEKLATSDTRVRAANGATAPMYTINPFQKKGRSMRELTSTHPPIAERIRILRSMAGASYKDYDSAYRKAGVGPGIIPPSALNSAGEAGIRAGQSPETGEKP